MNPVATAVKKFTSPNYIQTHYACLGFKDTLIRSYKCALQSLCQFAAPGSETNESVVSLNLF